MGCLPGQALVGVNWKADEEGERWFLTELETTWKQRVADVIELGKEAVHARDFIKMETSSTCTVTFFRFEAQGNHAINVYSSGKARVALAVTLPSASRPRCFNMTNNK
ncbi:hypothetical protein OIU78_006816 [Salix suchowensis]|nr:hypothetical protein OIU78_006816 [Salix suchowensis]